MRSVLCALFPLFVVMPAWAEPSSQPASQAASAPAPPTAPRKAADDEQDPLIRYGMPLGHSAAAAGIGAGVFALGLLGGGLVGVFAHSMLLSRLPSFLPPYLQTGALAGGSTFVVAMVAGASIAAPLALMMAAGVDTLAWVGLAAPKKPRQVFALLIAQAAAISVTVPVLVVAAGLSGLVAVAARWQPDRLQDNRERQVVTSSLGWGPSVVFLAIPATLVGVVLRTALYLVLGDDPDAPAHRWLQRLAARRT